MDSPVQIPFKSFINLRSDKATPVYLQIVFEFIKAIQLGLLPEGTKLPGTRILCKLLEINRNTLIKAFADLEAQGFIEILPNKGTFILSDHKKSSRLVVSEKTETKKSFYFKHSTILESPIEISHLALQTDEGLPDIRLIHTDELARLYVSKLKRQRFRQSGQEIQNQIHLNFKKQFSNFLNLTRGLRISVSNLLTTSSHETSLYLVAKVLVSQGDKVAVASPGYYLSNMILLDSGAEVISVPVDEEGINTNFLRKVCERQPIRILYLTSSYHYPTTTLLSAKRRIELLEMAQMYGFIVVEDDYDFDFHYDNNPVLPLAAFNANENVVYIGSFARSLPVGFNYGFVTGPEAFINELEKHKNILEPAIDNIKEQVLTEWIAEGAVHRLNKKNRKLYKERRDYLIGLLTDKLGDKISFRIPHRGLAIWIKWVDSFNLMKFKKKCIEYELFLPKNILYQNKNLTAIRMGFGSLDYKEMERVVDILSKALKDLLDE